MVVAKFFDRKGPVFPGLDVARRPVVEQAQAEHVVFGLGDRNGVAHGVARTDEDAQLQLDVHALAGGQHRCLGIGCLELALGAREGLARDADGGGPAVVADGHPLVVGHERVVGAEQAADVGGVVHRGVEVGVVANLRRHGELGLALRHQAGLQRGLFGRAFAQGARERQAQGAPGAGAQGHQGVELVLRAGLQGLAGLAAEQAGGGQGAQVDDLVANGHAAAESLLAAGAAEGGEGQVLDGEVAACGVGRGQPAAQGRVVGLVEHGHVGRVLSWPCCRRASRRRAWARGGCGSILRACRA